MASLSKDVEVANPTAEGTANVGAGAPSSAANRPTGAHLRQDALSLEIPVKVHGSRVTEVVRGVTPKTEPFEEQSTTMIIFPQGGVIRMSTSVATGQMLVLTNLKTKQDAICRVVKVRTFTNMQGYVEVEFTHPQPTYWGVQFPTAKPAAPATKPQAAAPEGQGTLLAPHEELKSNLPSDVSWAPAKTVAPPAPVAAKPPVAPSVPAAAVPPPAAPKPHVPAAKPESTFAGIETQMEVQPAASATANVRPLPPLDPRESHEVAKPVIKMPPPPPAAPVASSVPLAPAALAANASEPAPVGFPSLSMTELLGESDAAHATIAIEEKPAPAPKSQPVAPQVNEASVAAAAASNAFATAVDDVAAPASAASEAFGSRFDSGAKAAARESSKGSPNFLTIAAVVALVVVLGGGALYLRSQRANANSGSASAAPALITSAPSSSARPVQATSLEPSQPVQPAVESSKAASSNLVVAPHGNNIANPATNAPAPRPSAAPTSAAVAAPAKPSPSPAPAQPAPQPSGVTGNMVAESANSHPVTAQRSSGDDVEAPSVDAAPPADNSGDALPSVLASNDGPAAPEVKPVEPSAPARVGGNVLAPRILSSSQPIYPTIAKQAHIQGDVVIKTTIDQRGNVTHMEVVSGPAMLRGAAMEALKRWKYAPSMLNGEPISVEMLVTLKFRM